MDIYYKKDNCTLALGDTFEVIEKIRGESIDMIFADPPYFLSNDGFSNSGGKVVSVNKGDWDKISSLEEKHNFNREWIRKAKRVLQEGFKILNNITWQKTNPAPNLSCRYFTHSTETILWARKADKNARHYYNYELMKNINNGKQMKDVWTGPLTKISEKWAGKHPTQKPEYLLERIILASTEKGDYVLDPFVGSGTTGAVAKRLGRKFVGIDFKEEYLEIAKNRIERE